MSEYYIKSKGDERGPFAESQLRLMWSSGAITSDTLFRLTDSADWQPIGSLLDIGQSVASTGAPSASATTASASTAPRNKSQAGTAVVLVVLLLILAVMFFGNVHIITGGSLDSPRIVKKESFGLSETFIKIGTITSMPWISAGSRYPLSCRILQREKLIESDEDFRARKEREMKKEMERTLQNLTN